ncbi:hypothetical protein LPB41_19850 [Thalassospira sp. MA62]|nr:hypothetical protein [Thalassospira sp. MA62]
MSDQNTETADGSKDRNGNMLSDRADPVAPAPGVAVVPVSDGQNADADPAQLADGIGEPGDRISNGSNANNLTNPTNMSPGDGQADPTLVPETAGDYVLNLDAALGDVDPALNDRLHAAGFSHAQAQLVYDLAAEILPGLADEVKQASTRAMDRASLIAEFGGAEGWKKLAPKLEKWGQANLPTAAFDAMCQTADGVRALHRLMTGGQEAGLAGGLADTQQGDLRDDIRRKMNDPRYWRDRDPAIVAEVQAGFARLNGGS